MSHESLPFHYLAVDGPIGVGKTSLVEKLARRFEGVKILEDVDNPFLPDFYRDRPGAAFQTELTSCCRASSSSRTSPSASSSTVCS